MKSQKKIVQRIFKKAGGPAALVRRLKEETKKPITIQAVIQWERIPQEWVKPTSKITGFQLHQIRPDVYDKPETNVTHELRT
jgi:hypothetical protein